MEKASTDADVARMRQQNEALRSALLAQQAAATVMPDAVDRPGNALLVVNRLRSRHQAARE
jgi:hypothetical protein